MSENKRKTNNRDFKKLNQAGNPAVSPESLKIFRIFILASLMLLVFYPPYLRGLFFETEQLPTEIFVFSIFILFWVYKFINRDSSFLKTPLDYAAFGLLFVYLLSTVFAAVSTRSAVSELLKYCMFFSMFFMITEIAKSKAEKFTVMCTIVLSGIGVCIIGLDGAGGSAISNSINSFFPKEKPLFFDLFKDERIYSTLQYPNALAAYLLAIFFIAIAFTLISKKLWVRLLGISAAFILCLTFFLTQSRGTYILVPFVAVLYIVLLPRDHRAKGAVNAISAAIPAAGFGYWIYNYIKVPGVNELRLWLMVLGGIAATILLFMFVSFALRLLEKLTWKVYAVCGIFLIVSGVIITLVAFNVHEPLTFDNTNSKQDNYLYIYRYAELMPDKEYRLEFNANASAQKDQEYAYYVHVENCTEKSVLFGQNEVLVRKYEKYTNGNEKKEVLFKVPHESRNVKLLFECTSPGTKVTYSNARIVDVSSGKTVKDINLKYRFIPENIMSRFEEIGKDMSSLQRNIYNVDGMKMFGQRWFLGGGGGAWPLIYYANQSFFYVSTQTHNYFMQIAIESGLLGVLALLCLVVSVLIFIIYRFKNSQKVQGMDGIIAVSAFAGVITLLGHSLMDFDLSLSSVFLLLWELAAILNVTAMRPDNTSVLKGGLTVPGRMLKLVHPFVCIAISAVLLIISSAFGIALGESDNSKSAIANNNLETSITSMKNAANTDILNPSYKIDYASLLLRNDSITKQQLDEADKYIEYAQKQAIYDNVLISRIGDYYIATQKFDKAISMYDRMTLLKPFGQDAWQKKIVSYAQIVNYFLKNKDDKNGLKYLDKMMNVPNEVQMVNKKNMNPITLNAYSMQTLEKFKYIKNLEKGMSVDKVAFYSMNDLDVDKNGVPDQWSSAEGSAVNISTTNNMLNVTSSQLGYIQSRDLFLAPGKNYKIEVVLNGEAKTRTMPFSLAGIKNGDLVADGNIYEGTINVPADFKAQSSKLRLGFNGNVEIKSIKIYEI